MATQIPPLTPTRVPAEDIDLEAGAPRANRPAMSRFCQAYFKPSDICLMSGLLTTLNGARLSLADKTPGALADHSATTNHSFLLGSALVAAGIVLGFVEDALENNNR